MHRAVLKRDRSLPGALSQALTYRSGISLGAGSVLSHLLVVLICPGSLWHPSLTFPFKLWQEAVWDRGDKPEPQWWWLKRAPAMHLFWKYLF